VQPRHSRIPDTTSHYAQNMRYGHRGGYSALEGTEQRGWEVVRGGWLH
jgi:hypothetical protein